METAVDILNGRPVIQHPPGVIDHAGDIRAGGGDLTAGDHEIGRETVSGGKTRELVAEVGPAA